MHKTPVALHTSYCSADTAASTKLGSRIFGAATVGIALIAATAFVHGQAHAAELPLSAKATVDQAAFQGNPAAQYDLGSAAFSVKDYPLAAIWFKAAANNYRDQAEKAEKVAAEQKADENKPGLFKRMIGSFTALPKALMSAGQDKAGTKEDVSQSLGNATSDAATAQSAKESMASISSSASDSASGTQGAAVSSVNGKSVSHGADVALQKGRSASASASSQK